ncbi:LemA family protein [Bifidobacterium aquikefiricola]|uniref:LemA family protein n=1 Tax=Bifidobacterium aquikefiricola TaxID=3059038 RepID=A0AB39U5N5_9BIFI
MNGLLIAVLVIVVIVVILVLWGIGVYNALIGLRNRVANGWAQIDVQLKQRADLVPNLVETVKGYATHESEVFQKVTEARANAVEAARQGDPQQRAQAENQLSNALVNLRATAEAYPQLQANQNFMDLQNQLNQLEQKIAYARQFYNDVVQKFNIKIQSVPSNIIAGMFHFHEATFFEAGEQDRVVPQVKF